MEKPNPRFSLPLVVTSTLSAVFLILLVLLYQVLNAVQTENAILRQQIEMDELKIRSLQNQHEAERILRSHDISAEPSEQPL